ncbi:MAG: hypothetical protein HFE28_06815 [Clostridia bacterium]|nr:hypothetical protein [Clostridia bacterium]
MAIDIIDLTSDKYKNLNSLQLAMVRAAQAEKDKVTAAAAQEKQKLVNKLVQQNIVRSTLFEAENSRIDAQTEADVDWLRADLEHRLAYENLQSSGNESGVYSYPSNPNYYLPYSERFLVVRNYYMNRTSDPNARLNAFSMDSLAREYLGEYYQTLYDLLASYCK